MIGVTARLWTNLVSFGISATLSYAAASALYGALRARPAIRGTVMVLLSACVLATPLLVPAQARLFRTLAAIVAVTMLVKMYDLHVGARYGVLPTIGSVIVFLPNIFSLVHRKLDVAPRPPLAENVRRLAWAALAFATMGTLFVGTFLVHWRRFGFAAEHTVKVVTFFLMLVPLTAMLGAAWRLGGGRGLEFMNNPFASRTPADFWRRYNRPTHQFLQEDVFVPVSGRRHPFRGAVVVFVVSAAIHEYVFSMGVGRVQGYQTTFFQLQGLAVAATIRLKPRGPAAAAAVVATFAFNLTGGVLFFASVDGVFPFYVNDLPLWD